MEKSHIAQSEVPPLAVAELNHETQASRYETKVTKRTKLLKLELTGDVSKQLSTVQQKLFGLEIPENAMKAPAKKGSKWRTTDEILYAEARTSYDNIMKAFTEEPKVYKLESIKEKVWNRSSLERKRRNEYDDDRDDWSVRSDKSFRDKKRKEKSNEPQESPRTQDMKTFIDPFLQGDVEEVWKEKLSLLEKLTPREDLNGYEYKEDYDEQQYRLALINDFQDRLKLEIYRRRKNPTLTEQVEDVLYDMVETVCTKIDDERYQRKLVKKTKLKASRHPAFGAYRIRELEKKIGNEGQIVQPLTDLEFVTANITKGGYVLAQFVPMNVLLQHEHEREILRELQRKETEERESMRRLPLTKKLRIAVLSSTDMKFLIRRIAKDIMDSMVILPTQPYREKVGVAVNKSMKSVAATAQDPNKLMEKIQDRLITNMQIFFLLMKKFGTRKRQQQQKKRPASGAKSNRQEENVLSVSIPDMLEEAKKLKFDTGVKDPHLSRNLREYTLQTTQLYNDIPDSILIRLTLQYELPAAYKMRPKKTLQAKMDDINERAKLSVEENKIFLYEKYEDFNNRKRIATESISGSNSAISEEQQTLAREYIEKTKEQIEEKKKQLYLEEHIPVRKLVGSEYFNGNLKPQDLILPLKVNLFFVVLFFSLCE
jgi:large-conductance mechanosensitive channel